MNNFANLIRSKEVGNLLSPIDQRLTQFAMQIFVRSELCAKDIYIALVVIVIEYVVGLHSQRSLLFVSKYQVNPFVEMSTDVITLQGLG